ncbi:MAG: diphosphomevalonate decarboxylase [Gammaproteobacteria bacterium]|nr:diphosphomevalonate decarboxylase [Gammaproteobacteria bacterium]
MSVTAHAHPNIALVKYWGKAPRPGNVPAAPSLSITLDSLTTTTTVRITGSADAIYLNDQPASDAKIAACLDNLRRRFDIPPLEIRTSNDFPTAAGLASSASGFAALVTAVDAACDLGLSAAARSGLARQASASAARSLFGGFVTLDEPDWQGRPLLDAESWPLEVVVAVTDEASKSVSSTAGMRASAASPYFPAWVESTRTDFAAAQAAVDQRDFERLSDIAEHSCLKMHGLMLATRPGLMYWNPATLACLQRIRELRAAGLAVFFTVDAGPQVKAVCLPASRRQVAEALADVPGVRSLLTTGLGRGAWVEAP